MTGIACLAYQRAGYLSQLTTRITSLASVALKGNAYHFDEKLCSVKPHPGQNRVAQFAVVQGVELRSHVDTLSPALKNTVKQLREHSPFLSTDRALEYELRLCLELIRKQHWELYD